MTSSGPAAVRTSFTAMQVQIRLPVNAVPTNCSGAAVETY